MIDRRIPPLWETRPEDFPLAGEVLDLADGPDRPLALRRGARPRGAASTGRSGASRIPPGLRRTSRRRDIEGEPLIGCFGHLNASEAAARSCCTRSRGSASAHPDARLLLVGSATPRVAALERA